MLEAGDVQALCHAGGGVSLLAWESEDVPGLEILLHGKCTQRWKKKGKGPHAFVLGLRTNKGKDGEITDSKSTAVRIAEMPLRKPCGGKLPTQPVFTQ